MSLPISNKNFFPILLWLIILALLTILFLIFYPKYNYSIIERINLANNNIKQWNIIEAEKILEPVAEENISNLKFVNTYIEVLLKQGKIKSAIKYLEEITKLQIINEPQFLLNKSQIYYFYGEPDSAEIFARNAIEISLTTGNKNIVSKAYNVIGLINFYRAHYDSALIYQCKALEIANNKKYKNVQADALRQIGVLYWYKGKLDSALNNFYLPALNLYREVNDKIGEAITLNDIGLIYFDKKNGIKNIIII